MLIIPNLGLRGRSDRHIEDPLARNGLLPHALKHGADLAVERGHYGRTERRYVLGGLCAPELEELGARAEP